MNVLVDTPIWSLAFRRNPRDLSSIEHSLVQTLRDLIQEDRAQMLGPIRQEVLSGIKHRDQFEKLRLVLKPFDDERLITEDYEMAADSSNKCRAQGIAMSSVDALVCAVAQRKELVILTTDTDFKNYSRILPLKLHSHARAN
jgi:predicted nucleic acid-binding protein